MPRIKSCSSASGWALPVLTGPVIAVASLLLPLASSPALADDAGLLRCRAITDASARLACYDALVPSATTTTTATPATATSPAAAMPGTTAQPTVAPQDRFGLESAAQRNEPDAIESSIAGRFLGWNAGADIRLANGQIWQIADGSSAYYSLDNPKVKVRRGLFGVFYLEIDGANRTPKVRRVQ